MTNWHKLVTISSLLTIFSLGSYSLIAKVPALSLSDEKVAQKAREITVKIEGCAEASGVIYDREDNTYSVLTAYHILVKQDLTCLILTPDGEWHRADAPMIRPVPGVDLGILRFNSNNSYAVGKLDDSNEVVEGQTIYVAGAPQPTEAIPDRIVIINNGTIAAKTTQPRDGYTLIYNAVTRPGMSGGPVLNDRALIIGIHGRGDRDQRDDKTGLNLGIPIQVLLSNRSEPGEPPITNNPPSDPKDAEIYWKQANAYFNGGDYERAIAEYNKAIELNPDFAQAYSNRGLAYYEKEEYDKAMADYNKAIEINPNLAQAYNGKGVIYFKRGEYERAIAEFNKAIETDHNYIEAYNNRGNSYFKLEQYGRAIADYSIVIQVNPGLAAVYNNRGQAYYKQGEYQRAIADYSRVIQLNPNYATYNKRGQTYYKREEYQKAIADYSKAIELNPNYADAYYNRGLAHERNGDTQEAIRDFQKAADLYQQQGNQERYQKALDRLEQLR